METFFEVALAALVNIRTVEWDTSYPGVKYSTALTLISLVLIGVLPPYFILLFCCKFKVFTEEKFKKMYGSGIEGVNKAKKVSPSSILANPVFFFGRRILFAVSAIYLQDFLFAQLAIQTFVSFFILCYMLHFKTIFESP